MRRLLFLLLVTTTAFAGDEPAAHFNSKSREIVVTGLPDVLSHALISGEIDSGLTNSLVLSAVARKGRGKKHQGGALIDIRYDLWDEVYSIHWIGVDGTRRQESVDSREALRLWWLKAELPVLGGFADFKGDWRLNLELSFVPFSETEQDETRQWISGNKESDPQSPGTKNPGGFGRASNPYAAVVDVLVVTSISRRALLTFEWRIPITTEASVETKIHHGSLDPSDPGDSGGLSPP
jgi:hypothetical protein